MPPRWNENRLTAKLGIDYPVIQGPLGGLSSQKLTAAVSNFGGLGSFAAHSLTPGAIKDVIAEIRALTSKPFAMNLWVSMEDEGARTSDENAFNRSLAPLAVHLAALGRGQCAGDRRRWHRRCARRSRCPGSWRRGRANGNGIPGVRGVRRQPPSSPGFTREKSRAHRADNELHRKTRAGNPQPLAGGVEPGGNGDSTLSIATKTRQKPR